MNQQHGVVIDCARRYCSVDVLTAVIDELAAGKGDFLQLHFSDNEGYGIASDYLALNSGETNPDYLTQQEVTGLIHYANDRNIQVIPDFDVPAHSKYWLERHQELYPQHVIQTDFDETVVDYFGNEAAVAAVKQMIDDITALFQQRGLQRLVIGADEVPGSGSYQQDYIHFINTIADYVTEQGYTPAIWNDGVTTDGLKSLAPNVEILYWQQPEQGLTADEFLSSQRAVYNYNFYTAAFLPNVQRSEQAVHEQASYIKNHHRLTRFCHHDDPYHAAAASNIAGSAMTFWNEEAAGLSDEELLLQLVPLIRAFLQTARQ
ncbi:family 20 glycosylhydrolase [Macrococcus equipercicus]|uniref:beta-N-acetylhexosaminidase n=1 Tax=Macrococcus equipercicus TaxID=69967 RepID=A0ABQ6RAQ3_9STAP|nr:family 20 glycosylhydrolase [Macrococcus equipercicus]KAA1040333.1 family 20 glycosylhydrolase [Macrococcus equipercicus]